jgi:hypothetical protein
MLNRMQHSPYRTSKLSGQRAQGSSECKWHQNRLICFKTEIKAMLLRLQDAWDVTFSPGTHRHSISSQNTCICWFSAVLITVIVSARYKPISLVVWWLSCLFRTHVHYILLLLLCFMWTLYSLFSVLLRDVIMYSFCVRRGNFSALCVAYSKVTRLSYWQWLRTCCHVSIDPWGVPKFDYSTVRNV